MAPWQVLTGPPGAGKTTLGALVAADTDRAFVDLDAVAEDYYAEVGWSLARLQEQSEAVGRLAAETAWEPARAHAVVRVVADHPGAVVALGAGHTSYTDPDHRAAVRAVLGRCPDVVRLLPWPDRDASLLELRRRCEETKGRTWVVDGHDLLAGWLDDPDARRLTTRTLHTGDEAPEVTARRLVDGSRG